MPTLPDAARRHYLIQKALAAAVVTKMRQIWARIDIADLDRSWRTEQVRAFAVMVNGQVAAAGQADAYLTAVLDEQRIDATRTASIDALTFAGTASDGRDLQTLLYEPVITTKVALAAQHSPTESFALGEAAFMRIAATQIQDAGRMAVGTAIAARPAVTSYTRMLNPPSCARCAVLAGRVYRWNSGFQRHPFCDCRHVPSAENIEGHPTTNPKVYFNSLTAADQDRYFTKAGAEVIRQGGDIGQVVNARLGMYQANGRTFTNVGASRRGIAGKRLKGQGRMMPETILEEAGDDRELAVELLRQHAYLI